MRSEVTTAKPAGGAGGRWRSACRLERLQRRAGDGLVVGCNVLIHHALVLGLHGGQLALEAEDETHGGFGDAPIPGAGHVAGARTDFAVQPDEILVEVVRGLEV